jgi:hypothetical protein
MGYDGMRDEYTCANNKKLRVAGTEIRVSRSGYESGVTVYESEGCEGCPGRERCSTSQKNRRMEVSRKLLALRGESEANIKSDEGILLRTNRSIQVEGAFGVTKEGRRFRRFFIRGKAGVCPCKYIFFGRCENEKSGLWFNRFGGFWFCVCGVCTTPKQGIYDGIGVWLVSESNFTAWKNANNNGYPTPTAIGSLPGNIEALSAAFSVQFKEPFDYSGNGRGYWNQNQQGTNWTASSGDYYVLLMPKYFASGVSGKGNMSWDFESGKVSAADGNLKKIQVSNTRQSFSLTDFQNVREVSY